MIEQNKYPRFIQSQPCGIDKFEGGSQNRLASAISSYMQMVDVSDKSDSKDNLPRIIGLEGGWGVGKSNVIKMLGFKLPETYYTFEYDAWGHQEDLQRRSILEMLTTQLIDDSILTGNTTVNVKGGIPKKVSWNEKLKLLLARKSEVITEKYPKLNISIVVSALVAISTPIFTLIAFLVQPEEPTWWSILLSILIAITPILFAIIAWVCAYRKNKKYKNLGYLFAIYTDKIENDIIYETISEEEPTVVEFKSWMKDISDFLGTKSKKLVIVFDNMDRLPDKKVKELWSSIHTFFADTGFENIWVIIPYDLIHLSSAFGEKENNSNLELAKHFIHKTFPIVYAVPPPVITDLKNIFNNLFSDAFGNHEINNKDKINRIFRLERPNATVREVIYFINELVTLKSIWNNEIELKYIALFALKKDEILSDPVNQVLSGDYQSIYIKQVLGNDELVQESIAALTFGVEISHAKQIPLKKYILNCLNNKDGYDINKYLLVNNHFTSILDDSIRDADIVQIDTLINVMSNLKLDEISEINRKTIDNLWIFLSNQKMESQVSTMNFDDVYKKMFLNTHQDDMHIKIIKYLCNGFQTFTEFKGREYYKAIRDLEVFLEQSQIKLPLELKEIEKSPEVFIDYVNASEVNYKKYRLKTRSDYLNKYYANLLPENLGNVKALSFLKSDEEYNFTEFIKVLEEYIYTDKVTVDNFKSIFEAYKDLSNSTPLRTKLSSDVIQSLFNSFSGHPSQQEYLELIAMRIAGGISQAILDIDQIEYVANNIEYYSDYGDLMVSCLNINNAALNQVLKYMTLRKLGDNIDLDIILRHFFQIKEKIDVTEESLIEALDQWTIDETIVNNDNIQEIIPNSLFYEYSFQKKCDLTYYINGVATNKFIDIKFLELYNNKDDSSYYWNTFIYNFVQYGDMDTLTDNLKDYGRRILTDVAQGVQKLPLPKMLETIINKLQPDDYRITVRNIRDDFTGKLITPNLFLFFSNMFQNKGGLLDTVSDSSKAVRRIIQPVINDKACLDLIISNSEFYSEVITNAGKDADEFKSEIAKKVNLEEKDDIYYFAKSIGAITHNIQERL